VDVAGEEIPDVAPEHIKAIDLSALHLPGPDLIPCLPLNHRLAQKIHGMTHLEKREGETSSAGSQQSMNCKSEAWWVEVVSCQCN